MNVVSPNPAVPSRPESARVFFATTVVPEPARVFFATTPVVPEPTPVVPEPAREFFATTAVVPEPARLTFAASSRPVDCRLSTSARRLRRRDAVECVDALQQLVARGAELRALVGGGGGRGVR